MTITEITSRLASDVLEPMKRDFVGKDEIIDLLGVCLVGGENLFFVRSAWHSEDGSGA